MNPVEMADMILSGEYALEQVDDLETRVQLMETSNEALLLAKEEQAKKVSDLEKSVKEQSDEMAALKEENRTLREDFAKIQAYVDERVKAESVAQRNLFDNKVEQVQKSLDNEMEQVRKSFDNKAKEVESKLVDQKSEIEGLRLPLSDIEKTVESHKKNIFDQKERLDIYTKAHDDLSNAWRIVNTRVSLKRNSDGSPCKRKNSMSGESQGSAKRQSTSEGPEATGDGSLTSTQGSG